jgi:hypothetical protein
LQFTHPLIDKEVMQTFKKFLPGVTTVFLLASSMLASAANAETFTASLTNVELLIPQPLTPSCPQRGVLNGYGASSLLGASTAAATDCVTVLEGGRALKFDHGVMALSTAPQAPGNPKPVKDAGTIFLSYSGTFVLEKITATEMTYTMTSGSFTITGGTGKYVRATGGGSMTGQTIGNVDPAIPGKGSLKAEGLISY